MFAKNLNQIRIDLSITPQGPLLIRSGRTGADPTRPDLECVRTTVDGKPSVYIPGSSLKGVLRSCAERMLKTEGLPITDTFCRDAQKAFNQRTPGDEAYRGSCPLGRTFGNLHVKGHVGISDLVPGGAETEPEARREHREAANAVERRNGVAIDRLLGSAKGGALFDQEVVVGGRFDGEVLLRNVQLYQLTLVLLTLRDLDEGFVKLGSSTTRGCGRVRAEIRAVTVESHRGQTPKGRLYGLERLLAKSSGDGEELAKDYELFSGDEVELPAGHEAKKALLRERLSLPGSELDDLAEGLVEGPWQSFLDEAHELSRTKGGKPWRA